MKVLDPRDEEIRVLELALKRAKKERANVRRKAALARPEVKAKLKAALARPEVKAKRSASMKAALARPEVKAKRAAAREIGQLIKDAREGAPKRARASAVGLDYPEDALEVALFGPRKRAVA